MEVPNPYATPESPQEPSPHDSASFGELVRAWEKLRVLFNGILILPGAGVIALWVTHTDVPIGGAILLSIPVAIGANAAFCLGPMTELYFRALFRGGAPIGKGRWLIFGAGLVVSSGFFLLAALMAVVAGEE